MDLELTHCPIAARDESPATMRGQRLGRYLLLRELGRGGMGRVWLARDDKLGREVALKTLREGDHVDGALTIRFVREAQALAQLRHPNVVEVFEVVILDGVPCIALEHVPGGTLRRWLGERRRGLDEILAVFVGAGHGLTAAHAAGLVHRDFKPGNVMVGNDGRARVMDFGLARLLDAIEEPSSGTRHAMLDTDLTATGSVVGTPGYMAPEQHRGEPVDARADQYAFCVALHEAVTGRHPFVTADGDPLDLAIAKHAGAYTRGAARLPRWLARVIARGLAPDPHARWPSMHALTEQLRARGRTPGRRLVPALAGVAALALATTSAGTTRDRVHAGLGRWSTPVPAQEGSAAARDTLAQLRTRIAERRLAGVDDELAQLELVAGEQRAPRLRAEVLISRGDVARIDRELPRAAAHYDAAYHLAFAAHHDALASRALIAQLEMTGARMSRTAEALRRAPEAAALVERAGEPLLAIQLATTLGMILLEAGDPVHAIAQLERSRELAEHGELPDLEELHIVHNALARAWNQRGDNARAQRHMQRALELATAHYGPIHPSVAAALGNLGNLLAGDGHEREAEQAFARALTISEQALGPAHASTFSVLSGLGVVAGTRGDHAAALGFHLRALAVRGEPRTGDVGAARVRNNLAETLAELGRNDEAIALSSRALAELESALQPSNTMIATALRTRATIERRGGHLHAALRYLDRAITIFAAANDGRHDELAGAWTTRAELLLALDRPREALAAAAQALARYELRDHAENRFAAAGHAVHARALARLGRRAPTGAHPILARTTRSTP